MINRKRALVAGVLLMGAAVAAIVLLRSGVIVGADRVQSTDYSTPAARLRALGIDPDAEE